MGFEGYQERQEGSVGQGDLSEFLLSGHSRLTSFSSFMSCSDSFLSLRISSSPPLFVALHCHSSAPPGSSWITLREGLRLGLGDSAELQVLVVSLVWQGLLHRVKLHKLLIFVVALKALLRLVDLFQVQSWAG